MILKGLGYFFSFSFKNEMVRCQARWAASLLYGAGEVSLLKACRAPSDMYIVLLMEAFFKAASKAGIRQP